MTRGGTCGPTAAVVLLLAGAAAAEEPRIPVMILGTVHLDNPGRDVHNLKVDDMSSRRRQGELEVLVDRLASFNPTKIAVEVPRTAQYDEHFAPATRKHSTYVSRYRGYLADQYELAPGEVDQIAFRLGKRLGHGTIHGVDVLYPYDERPVREFAAAHGQEACTTLADDLSFSAGRQLLELLARSSLSEFLARVNEPEWHLAQQRTYLPLLCVGRADDYPGADLLRDWYARNLRIFTNIVHLSDSADDRILVVFGLGHGYYLRQLVTESPRHDLIEPSTYLR